MNMAGYTKLFNSILASTIWRSDDKTRIVWITLLAMADKDGIAEGSVPGLADLARVSIEDCESALAELMAPDKYSRTTEFEGRRIEPVDGGWLLLNHAKYRAKMSEDDIREKNRQRQAKWREKHKSNADSNAESQDVTPSNVESRQSRHTEAESYTEAEEKRISEVNQETTLLLEEKNKRGSRIDANFQVTDKMREWATLKFPSYDIDGETEKFVNYWLGASGRNAVKMNWEATWRNWFINEKQPILKKSMGIAPTKIDLQGEAEEYARRFAE